MDNWTAWLAAAGSLITVLGGWEFVRHLMNRKTERRKAEAEADNAELETLRKQCDWFNEKIIKLNERVDSLYATVHELERKNIELMKRNADLELQLKIAEYNRCERPDDDCIRRLPQRYKCRLKDLLAGKYDDPEDSNKTE